MISPHNELSKIWRQAIGRSSHAIDRETCMAVVARPDDRRVCPAEDDLRMDVAIRACRVKLAARRGAVHDGLAARGPLRGGRSAKPGAEQKGGRGERDDADERQWP
jgi:hypothetical protein